MTGHDAGGAEAAPVNRRRFLISLTLGGAATLLAACAAPAAPAPTSAPKAADSAAKTEAPAKPAESAAKPAAPAAGSSALDALVAPAKAEGEVVVFMGRAGSRQLRDGIAEFEKKYGIKLTAVIGSGSENSEKILAERDTGIFTGDVWMGGLTTMNTRLVPKGVLDPIGPYLVNPEITDKSHWWKGQHYYGDIDHQRIFLFAASPQALLSYNTNLVKSDDIKSWWDLLDPKWKGKIVSRDPTVAGTGSSMAGFYFHPQLGQEFIRKLFVDQEVTLTKDGRQGAEWLALGKYSLYFIQSGNDPRELKDQGLPVEEVVRPLKEGAWLSSGGTGTLGVFNRPAHPNATKLFVNWWLSQEGQLTAQRVNPEDESLREDISKEAVLPQYRRVPGVEYMYLDSEPETLAKEGEVQAFMKKLLEGRG
ncbi:MAG: ABC transporter substrate-binding protein [Chloroflexota bacterium]